MYFSCYYLCTLVQNYKSSCLLTPWFQYPKKYFKLLTSQTELMNSWSHQIWSFSGVSFLIDWQHNPPNWRDFLLCFNMTNVSINKGLRQSYEMNYYNNLSFKLSALPLRTYTHMHTLNIQWSWGLKREDGYINQKRKYLNMSSENYVKCPFPLALLAF